MRSPRAIPLVFWAVAITGTICLWPHHRVAPNRPQRTVVPAMQSSPCLTYPHALVACGVRSMEDVDAARTNDSALREHYADLGILRPAVLRYDEMDYASFRQGNQIVWTAQTVKVAAGELVLEDRAGNKVRGRCGNRLSPIPRTPKAFVMPPEMQHESPVVTFTEAPYLPPPPLEQVTFPLPPVVAIEQLLPPDQRGRKLPVPVAGSFAPVPGRTPVVGTPVVAVGTLATPEPGTMWLMALSLGGLALSRKLLRNGRRHWQHSTYLLRAPIPPAS